MLLILLYLIQIVEFSLCLLAIKRDVEECTQLLIRCRLLLKPLNHLLHLSLKVWSCRIQFTQGITVLLILQSNPLRIYNSPLIAAFLMGHIADLHQAL